MNKVNFIYGVGGLLIGFSISYFCTINQMSKQNQVIAKSKSKDDVRHYDFFTTPIDTLSHEFLGLYAVNRGHRSLTEDKYRNSKYQEDKKKLYKNTVDDFELYSLYKKNDEFWAWFIYKDAHRVILGNGKVSTTRRETLDKESYFEIGKEKVYLAFSYMVNTADSQKRCPVLSVMHDCEKRPVFNEWGGCTHGGHISRLSGECIRYTIDEDIQ